MRERELEQLLGVFVRVYGVGRWVSLLFSRVVLVSLLIAVHAMPRSGAAPALTPVSCNINSHACTDEEEEEDSNKAKEEEDGDKDEGAEEEDDINFVGYLKLISRLNSVGQRHSRTRLGGG